MDYGKQSLKVSLLSLCLAIPGVAIILFTKLPLSLLGLVLIVIAFLNVFRCMRCPYCRKFTEVRGKSFCPECGGDLRDVSDQKVN